MFANQKSQEIAYALMRVAAQIRRMEFRQRIEKLALELLEEVAGENFEKSLKVSASIESLVTLGKAIYEIEPTNATIILNELSSLNVAIRQSSGLEKLPDLREVFSAPPAVIENRQENGNGINATIRQSSILEKIRQSSNRQVQLKDLIAVFPDVSERTMRYDLQKLCGQGVLLRVGNGGPGVYYTLSGS